MELVETSGQLIRRIRVVDGVPEEASNFVPNLIVRVLPAVVQVLFSRLKGVRGRHSVFIPAIARPEDLPSQSPRSRLFESPEPVFRNLFGQGPPGVMVAQQDQVVWLGRYLLRAPQFLEADPHYGVTRSAPEASPRREAVLQTASLEFVADLLNLFQLGVRVGDENSPVDWGLNSRGPTARSQASPGQGPGKALGQDQKPTPPPTGRNKLMMRPGSYHTWESSVSHCLRWMLRT
jgi:hypothetical protein